MHNRRGQIVAFAYVSIFVIAVLGGALLNHSMSLSRTSQLQQIQADLLYWAEGGVEDALSQFSQDIANFQIDANAPRYPQNGFITTAFSSGASASSVIEQAEPSPRAVLDPDDTTIFVKNYQITTTAAHPSSNLTMTIHQIIARRIIYTFQHAVFYDGDLEWLPGADMTLMGRVHSNSDIYLDANTLLMINNEYLRAAGNIYNRRKDDGTSMPGLVAIKKAGSSPAEYPNMDNPKLDSSSANWATESQIRWAGTVKSAVHGVTKRAVPVVGSIAPGGFYDSKASVKVTNCAITENGSPLVEGVNIPVGTCTTTIGFYNNREGKYVKMSNLDLNKLGGGTFDGIAYPNHLPSNGLIYATRNDAPPSQQPGIELVNGSEIKRTAGLTVVSNDPVYIKGNYNTVSKKPTAVIADAANLLSNSWSDSNSTKSLNDRVASATTVNTAFIAGIKPTAGSRYSGGLENYPRFHEKWTAQTMTITGSFVSLWDSQIATGNWVYGAPQYTAPNRVWSYDLDFSTGTNMPPFTPWAVEIVKGAWWKN